MIQSRRLRWCVGVTLCLASLLFACAPQPSSDEERSAAVDATGTRVERASATPARITPTLQTGTLKATASVPSGAQGLVNEAFTVASFDASLFLFVELIEERVSPLEGGQTTSFAGDFSVYRYDEGQGTIEDEMTFPIDEALRLVVGRILTVRIGDNVAFNGQLYGYPFQDLTFLPVVFTSMESGGRLCFIYEEDESCLDPGASVTFPTTEKATLTIINHGFLNKSNLIDVR